MLLSEVVSLLPLMNVVLVTYIEVVMVVVSLSDLHVPEFDTSGKSSQITGFNVLLFEVGEHLLGFGVVNFEDLGTGQSGVVAAIADGSGVVIGVELVEEHTGYDDILLILSHIIAHKYQSPCLPTRPKH